MFKKLLINFSMIFISIYFNDVFFEESNATEQQSQPIEQSQVNVQASEQNTVGNGVKTEGIQPDSVVAISAGTNGSGPQVFYTEKGAVPSNWKGWFYIMSGAEYTNYIQNGLNDQSKNIQQIINQQPTNNNKQPISISNVPHYAPPQISQQIIGRPGERQQYVPPLQSSNNSVVTNKSIVPNINQQTDVSQPTATQQPTVIQQPVAQQSIVARQPITGQQMDIAQATSNTLVKEITGGEKVEQGKPDNEVPEVLIHDGAVYTLANSVEVTNTTNNKEVKSPIRQSVQQVTQLQSNQSTSMQTQDIQNQNIQPQSAQPQPPLEQQTNQFVEAVQSTQGQEIDTQQGVAQQAIETTDNSMNVANNVGIAENNNQGQPQQSNLPPLPVSQTQQNNQ